MPLNGSETTAFGVTGVPAMPSGPFLGELIAANKIVFDGDAHALETLEGEAHAMRVLGGEASAQPE